MKLSSITCAPVLVAMVLVGCADNTKPAADPSMEPAHTTSAAPAGTPATVTNTDPPMPATTTTSTDTPDLGTMGKTNTTGTASNSGSNNGANNGAMPTTIPAPQSGTQGQTPVTTPAPAQPQPVAQADNTRMNTRDRNGTTATPMDQGNSASDIKITADIRKSVVGDSAMSFNAKNVKIITKDAHVVLRGTVNTMAERQAIEAKAKATAGVADVNNQIDVKK